MNLDTIVSSSPRDVSGLTNSSEPLVPIRLRRILVADDDEFVLNLLSTVLADAGFDVKATTDGQEAWEALLNQDYDLLVTDNEMPRLTGLALLERLRDAGMSLPVIIASGNLSEEAALDYPQLQITAVILKPFSSLAFLDIVKDAFQASSGKPNVGQGTFHRPHAGPEPIR